MQGLRWRCVRHLSVTPAVGLLDELALGLHAARLACREVPRLTERQPDLTLAQAYAVQAAGIALRRANGERIVGCKMGLTSEGKRQQMNLHAPVYGVLTDAMQVVDGGALSLGDAIHCKVEPEIAFRLRLPLRAGMSRAEAWACVDGVAAALEVLDSRYVGFKYFSLPDVVADNSSSFRFVVGPWSPAAGLDVRDLALRMAMDGAEVAVGRSAEISGDPVVSLVQLGDLAAEYGLTVPAGWVVLSGAATAAVALTAPGTVALDVAPLARVGFGIVA